MLFFDRISSPLFKPNVQAWHSLTRCWKQVAVEHSSTAQIVFVRVLQFSYNLQVYQVQVIFWGRIVWTTFFGAHKRQTITAWSLQAIRVQGEFWHGSFVFFVQLSQLHVRLVAWGTFFIAGKITLEIVSIVLHPWRRHSKMKFLTEYFFKSKLFLIA